MIQMPKNWARVNVKRFHSKSAAYAEGFATGWEAALRAVQAEHTAMMPDRILGYPNRTDQSIQAEPVGGDPSFGQKITLRTDRTIGASDE